MVKFVQEPTSPAPLQKLPYGKDLEIFIDGACPLCQREAAMINRMDRLRRVKLTDISTPGFDASSTGYSLEQLMAEIHGRLPDGKIISGVDVFRRVYTILGFGWAMAPTRLPGIRQFLDKSYGLFARNRLRLTGRCSKESCSTQEDVPPSDSGAPQDSSCPPV
ncbi:thiol-disulfide oxidoreductase DCC family protein [Planctomicrobium sp. SH668]|uniref:thiol-disulfide oxidoreductase DCC family protein n=1 Tax=Planctomicrobium sp. SH668 TaxID=3448126 RepID=UPI003F5B4D1A